MVRMPSLWNTLLLSLADAPEPLDRQRIEELLHLVRLHDDQGVRLLQVAGDLGQELVGRHAHRGHQPQFAGGWPV